MNRKPRRKRDASGFDPDAISRALDAQVQAAAGRVPPEVMAKLLSLRQIIEAILPRSEGLPLGSQDFFLIERTATYYLPTTLESYLALPRESAAKPIKDGKTAKQIVIDQLSLLERKMREIAIDLSRNDADRLLVHGRFLEDRFGHSPLSLKTPTAGDGDSPPASNGGGQP